MSKPTLHEYFGHIVFNPIPGNKNLSPGDVKLTGSSQAAVWEETEWQEWSVAVKWIIAEEWRWNRGGMLISLPV